MKKAVISFVAVIALGFSLAASANTIVITAGNPNNQGTANVLFNDNDGLQHSGSLVQGNFNGNGAGFFIDFTSASGNHQIMGSGGQATVEGLNGNNPFTSLTFGLEHGATFTKAILDPVATANGTIIFTVNYLDASGSPYTETLNISGNGNNFFGIEAFDGAKITQITFSSEDTRFSKADQFRLGGFAAATSVPDGGVTVMLLGFALSGCAAVRRFLKN